MSSRSKVRDELRDRILDATIELHTERGILGTSWRDIAERADVAVTTVYNHFPSLDELVPACGDLLMQRLRPPSPEQAVLVVGTGGSLEERLERIGDELYGFYERGGAHLDIFPGERELSSIQEWEAYQRSTVEAFVREAAKGTRARAETIRLVSVFFDLSTFRALESRGFDARSAAPTMARAAAEAFAHEGRSRGRRR